jgi:hypothetical protein
MLMHLCSMLWLADSGFIIRRCRQGRGLNHTVELPCIFKIIFGMRKQRVLQVSTTLKVQLTLASWPAMIGQFQRRARMTNSAVCM